ncbi:MAG: hypothetical protein ABJ004_18190 [Cyclobacteriaceae bacterium]
MDYEFMTVQEGILTSLRIENPQQPYNYLYSTSKSSYFHVSGIAGGNFQLHVCGSFDMLMYDETTDQYFPIVGDFKTVFTNYFSN